MGTLVKNRRAGPKVFAPSSDDYKTDVSDGIRRSGQCPFAECHRNPRPTTAMVMIRRRSTPRRLDCDGRHTALEGACLR